MLRIKTTHNFRSLCLKLRFSLEPGPMNPVARAKKIAAPDPLQADEEIAIFSGIDPFQLIGKSDWPLFPNANDPAGCPFFLRPIFSSEKGCLVTGPRQRASDASQICFRAAAGRKTAPNKSNVQF